jgi:hypothetical protein
MSTDDQFLYVADENILLQRKFGLHNLDPETASYLIL